MKLSKYLLTIAIGVSLVACDLDYEFTDSFPDSGSDSGGGDNVADLLVSTYNFLGNAFHSHEKVWGLMEQPSDELIGPTRGTDWSDNGVFRQLHSHKWDPTHRDVRNTWNDLNRGAFRAVLVLARNPNPQQAAEAKFLRAFYTYFIVDLYGQVPQRGADDGPDVNPTVLNRADATAFMIKDLEEAIPDLPDSGGPGIATKAAARTLLAKIYLNRAVYTASNPAGPYNFENADMDRVIELADAVTGYSLSENFWDNFIPANAETSPELIFTIPNKRGASVGADNTQNRFRPTLHYNTTPDGWNGFTTLSEFYDQFQDGDQRIGGPFPGLTDVSGLHVGFVVGQQFDENGKELTDRAGNPLIFTPEVKLAGNDERAGIRVVKYLPDFENVNAPENDYVLLRYADVLLMKAEALLRKGEAGPALTIVNDLRKQRGATELTSLDEAALLAERGREFYWEGWRRSDQIRFGTFLGTWQEKPSPSEDFRVLYPIPQLAIDTNPNLQQNAGY